MNANTYKYLLWQLIRVDDSGEFQNVRFEEVTRHLRAKTISTFLQKSSETDLSIIGDDDWADLNRRWHEIYEGSEKGRRLGATRRGISLLLAICLDSLQQLMREKDSPPRG